MNSTLSNREFEVFLLVVSGISNKEVADKIFTTEKTVKFHLTNIYRKLECKSRSEMTARYYQRVLPEDMLARIKATEVKPLGFIDTPPVIEAKPVEDLPLPHGMVV